METTCTLIDLQTRHKTFEVAARAGFFLLNLQTFTALIGFIAESAVFPPFNDK